MTNFPPSVAPMPMPAGFRFNDGEASQAFEGIVRQH